MDNNQLMNMMMQMMMQNNQMMSMMMAQMMPQQVAQIPAEATSPTVTFESQGVTNDLSAEIQALKDEIASLKSELAAEKQTREAYQKSYQDLQKTYKEDLSGFNALQRNVRKAEAYLGQSIEDVAAQGEGLSGDDYYDEKKKEWENDGLTNKEKYEKVKGFRDAFTNSENLIEF